MGRIEHYRHTLDVGRGRILVITGSDDANTGNPRVGLELISGNKQLGAIIIHAAYIDKVIRQIYEADKRSRGPVQEDDSRPAGPI